MTTTIPAAAPCPPATCPQWCNPRWCNEVGRPGEPTRCHSAAPVRLVTEDEHSTIRLALEQFDEPDVLAGAPKICLLAPDLMPEPVILTVAEATALIRGLQSLVDLAGGPE